MAHGLVQTTVGTQPERQSFIRYRDFVLNVNAFTKGETRERRLVSVKEQRKRYKVETVRHHTLHPWTTQHRMDWQVARVKQVKIN